MHFDQNSPRNLLVHFVLRFEQTIFMFVSDLGKTPPTLSLAQLSYRSPDHQVFYMLLGLFFSLYPVVLLDFQEFSHNSFSFLVTSNPIQILFRLHRQFRRPVCDVLYMNLLQNNVQIMILPCSCINNTIYMLLCPELVIQPKCTWGST